MSERPLTFAADSEMRDVMPAAPTEGEETTEEERAALIRWAILSYRPEGTVDARAAEVTARLLRDHAREKAGRLALQDERNALMADFGNAHAEIERLQAALRPFTDEAVRYEPDEGDGDDYLWAHNQSGLRIKHLRAARAALSPEPRT